MSSDTTARNSVEMEKHEDATLEGTNPDQSPKHPSHDLETASQSTKRQDELPDPDVVDWDSEHDTENPMNWTQKKKLVNIVLVSLFTFLTPLASSIVAPAIELVMEDLNSTSPELASFIVSVYLLGFCFGPLVIAPLSELYGRLYLYHICSALFIAWTIGCALAPNLAALTVFRFLAGLAGSCPVTIGAGTLADMIPRENRGKYMAGWIFGPLWGPILGPIAGGYMSEAVGWRWCFWLVAILNCALTAPMLLFMKESYAVILLERKTERLRKETGNLRFRSKLSSGHSREEIIKSAIIRPTKMLLFSPVTLAMTVYLAVMYGQLYNLFTAMSYVYDTAYGFSAGTIGLTFLGSGVGSFIGLFIAGAYSDRLMLYLVKRNGGDVLPKYRLPMCTLAGLIAPIGLFWFGWAADQRAHWVVPLVGTAFFAGSVVVAMMSVQTYLVDAFEQYAASAIAANTVLRSLVAALLPLSGRRLFESLGIGWGNSVLAFIGVILIPCPVFLYIYGERLRRKTLFNVTIQ